MSNEYRDWLMDLTEEQVQNMNLVVKYPFIISTELRNMKSYQYEYTALDELYDGWRIAFGDIMLEDILKIYNQAKDKDNFYVKFMIMPLGQLEVRFFFNEKEDGNLLIDTLELSNKYQKISRETCAMCGKKIENKYMYCANCTKIIFKGEYVKSELKIKKAK